MPITELKGQVTAEQAGRIDLMVRTLIDLPRSKLTTLFSNGCVSLNKTICENPAERVKAGDYVLVRYDPNQGFVAKKKPWSDRTFSIIHEDDSILVVDKSAGVLTVPTRNEEPNTLLERITAYLTHKKKNHEARLVHRLDRGMSGVIVFAKSPAIAKSLRQQFDEDQCKRVYHAIVNGVVEAESGEIDGYLDTHGNLSRFSTNDQKKGQHAVTRYQVRKRKPDMTLVELEMVTGRRHQARVHMAELGHHVLGDDRYRKEKYSHERWKPKRLALHSSAITMTHPNSGREVSYRSDLPLVMKKALRGMPRPE